jgi:alkylated DNA repair dioxygenase AlkB
MSDTEGDSSEFTTPVGTANHTSAPKNGSGATPEPHFPGGLGIGGGIGFVFSARTCLDVLPQLNATQIDREFQVIESIDLTALNKLKVMCSGARTRSKLATETEQKRELLKESLLNTMSLEVDTVVNKFDSLAQSVSRSLEEAEKKLDETTEQLKKFVTEQRTRKLPETPAEQHATTPGNVTEPDLEKPVRILQGFRFEELTYDTVSESFTFSHNLPGDRICAYFGSTGYSYGSIEHKAAAYPDAHPVLDAIFSEISEQDSSFTRENYSCLVTKYKDGKSSISMHSDDESVIVPGSNIYTVSFGATRTLRCYNTLGSLQEHLIKLDHGSVNVMTHSSQRTWKHGILPEKGLQEGRISLTFRRMMTPSEVLPSPERRKVIPRIQQPNRPARILLLTDSVHSNTPEHIFESVPGHICIKKKEYQLSNIDQYSHEFRYTDQVVVSMGVNDLSRYGHNARSLSAVVTPLFHRYSRQFPQCKFIFNTVLKTRDHKWLNVEIEEFNNYMFELSRDIRNLIFFDSDRFTMKVCRVNPGTQVYARGNEQSNNGIHLSIHMRRLISDELVRSVGFLSGKAGPRFGRCNWLRNVRSYS